jgi:glycosyltransferase involved in cell wall biosynthesis
MKNKILIVGKTPPPYMGPAIATQIILNSSLRDKYTLIHQQSRINKNLNTMGKLSVFKVFTLLWRYAQFSLKIVIYKPNVILIPISQSLGGFKKDTVFIKIAHFFKRKVIVQLRGSNFLNFYFQTNKKNQYFISNALKMCKGAIVLGNNLRYLFQPFFSEQQIFVVPNGADYPLLNEQKQTKHEEAIQLIYLGNLQPSKGILDVLQAVVDIAKDLPVHLNVVGKWRDEETKKIAFETIKEVKDSITFHGVLTGDAKLELLASSDILLFTPREPEGHPWVIVEALAAGLPIIATKQGAIPESVTHEWNGFLVETQNHNEIAMRINKLHSDTKLLKDMGENSRKHYENNFTEEKMVQALSNAFEQVIQAGK